MGMGREGEGESDSGSIDILSLEAYLEILKSFPRLSIQVINVAHGFNE